MMKKPVQKVFAGLAAAGIASTMALSAYAMTDADFKAQLLQELKIEAKLSAEEIEYVSQKIDDISRDDILTSLEDEISELSDSELKTRASADLESLTSLSDIDGFFDALDEIYVYLDEYYEENEDTYFDEEYEYDFSQEKAFILEEGQEELSYIEDTALRDKLAQDLKALESIEDEDLFFDTLDEIYEELDEYYGYEDDEYEDWYEDDFDFEDLKKEIIEELRQEENFIQDEALKAKMKSIIADLVNEDDEDAFFETLDALYEDASLEEYYESQGIAILMEEDFFDDDFNFEEEREEILEEIREEISEIDDETLRQEIESLASDLADEESEYVFFDMLDQIYEKIDNFYGIEWDDEDWEEYEEYNFSEEREEIIAALQEELEYIEDEALRNQVIAGIRSLESLTDEDQFFDALDDIYDEVDRYYDENEDLIDWDEEEFEDEEDFDEEEDESDNEDEDSEEDDDEEEDDE